VTEAIFDRRKNGSDNIYLGSYLSSNIFSGGRKNIGPGSF